MPSGAQVWDAAGNLTLNTPDVLYRFFGTVNTGTSDGSVTSDGFLQGVPMWLTFPTSYDPSKTFPNISVSGNVLSWSFPSSSNRVDTLIHYGVK